MTSVDLRRLLAKGGETAAILAAVIEATGTPVAVWDLDGHLLLGDAGTGAHDVVKRNPILCDGEPVGWLAADGDAAPAVLLLSHLLEQEAEKEDLLDEILDLYRQINLLFSLSDRLAATLELERVTQTILQEAGRLIQATGGAILMVRRQGPPRPAAVLGGGIPPLTDAGAGGGIVGTLIGEARAEVINDLHLDPRSAGEPDTMRSLICAPLASRNRILGAIILIHRDPAAYTAADLKLISALASQAAPAIENALLHERTLREAEARAERLQRQILELRIELDEAKQQEKVAEITGSDYYQNLRDRADILRRIIGGQAVS